VPERRWLKWLRRGPVPPPAHPGSEAHRAAAATVAEVEAAICDRVEGDPGTPPRDRLDRAFGAALAGQRSAVLVDGGGLASLGDGLAGVADRLTPVVVHATLAADAAWGSGPSAASGSGAFVAAASSAQEAADLALAARLLAEASLRPGVVLSEESDAEDLLLPTRETVGALLGWPDELVDSSTPAQRALFGQERRRAVRWFDPDHPVASGGPRSAAEATRADAGARLFFDAPVADLAAEALEVVGSWTGRPLAPVEASTLDGAAIVLVAWGRTAAIAREAIERLRARGKVHAAVLQVTMLRPFPAVAIAGALGPRRQTVVVLTPDEDPLAALPPFAREVVAAAPTMAGRVVAATYRSAPTVDSVIALLEAAKVRALPPRFALDAPARPVPLGFPRRDAMMLPLKGSWPEPELPGPAPVPSTGGGTGDVPALLRRIGAERSAPDSLPRFWGAIVQPGLGGGSASPDPLSVAGAVPGGSSALQPGPPAAFLPVLDSSACTGCGDCWPACPESAIGAAALPLEPILTAASRLAGTSGRSADALRRSHKHLAGKLSGSLSMGALTRAPLDEAWTWLGGQLGLADDELAVQATAFDETATALLGLAPSVTDVFFRDAEQGGAAELLVQAIDPGACTGCGLCVAACEDEALRLEERADDLVSAARARWSAWEEIPDTSGDTIARVAPEVGDAAAALLSRHASRAQLAGASDAPGSGTSIALRLVVAAAERHGHRAAGIQARTLAERSETLRARVDSLVVASLADAEPALLAEALATSDGGRPTLGLLADRLAGLDVAAPLDRNALLDCARTGAELARVRETVMTGADGLGRARFGFVASSGGRLGELLAWPRHPWFAPGVVVAADRVAAVATGVASAMVRDHLDAVRLVRRADLLAKPPAGLPARLAALEDLAWEALTDAEQEACAPLLVLVEGVAPAGLRELVRSGPPVKVIVLEGPTSVSDAAPSGSFAASSSVGAPDHLFAAIAGALAFPGGAWIGIDAPEPARDGFAPDATLAVATAALDAGTRVLDVADPREVAGVAETSDLDAVREQVREELATDQAAAVEAATAKVRQAADGEGLARLTERLLGLAGYTVGEG